MTLWRPGFRSLALLALLLAPAPAWPAAAADPAADLPEEYRLWLEEVDPILTKDERAAFLKLEKDYQRDAFIERFWQARDPYPDTARNELREAWATRVAEVQRYFGSFKEDRSRFYLLNGPPAARIEAQCSGTTWPLEVWAYQRSERIREEVLLLVFYRPFNQGPFRLWYPYDGVRVLMQFAPVGTSDLALIEQIARNCLARDDVPAAIAAILRRGRMDFDRVLEKAMEPIVPISREWVSTFNSYSTDLAADVAQLPVELAIAYPGRRQNRTVVQGTLSLPAAEAAVADISGARSYDFVLNGEVLLGRKLFDSFRYKFDLPAATVETTIPLVFERFLRPGKYTLILKLEDLNGNRFARTLQEIEVPVVEGAPPPPPDPESARILAEANAAIATLDNTIQIVQPRGEMQAGLVRFDTLTTGPAIEQVRFTLDGRPLLTKNRPPYSVELDLGEVPRTRALRASAFDAAGREVAWDEIQVNASVHRFATRLIEPRRGQRYTQSLRAEAEVELPEGGALERVEFYLNETLVATLYQPPFTQPIVLPPDGAVAYVRAVAYQTDGNSTEDLVFVNAPENLEELDVQFVELYTTVLDAANRPVANLEEGDFSIREDDVPQTITRFERLENLPIHVAILLDVSASMEPNLEQAKAAALKFYSEAITPKDRGALIVFNDHPLHAVKLTNKVQELGGGLAGLKAERGTSLYDSVVFSLFYFNGVKGQRAILLLSDGKDEGSRFDFEEMLDFARRAGVAIYPIGLGLPRGEGDVRKVLKRLGEETGGRTFFIKEIGELAAIYEAIQKELRSRYLLAYQSTNSSREIRFRMVDVDVARSGLDAKTMRGYYP